MSGTIMLKTERLVLRRHIIGDAEVLYKRFGIDEKMFEYTGWNPYATEEKAKKTVRQYIDSYSDDRFYGWAIESDGRLIGTIGAYDYDPEENIAEIGGSIDPDYWGKGYASEALRCVLVYLTEHEGINTVKAWCAADNIGSLKAIQKSGMLQTGVEIGALAVGKRSFDKLYFGYSNN